MSTDFLSKKWIRHLAYGVVAILVFCSCAYACFLSKGKKKEWNAAFYFLLSEDSKVEVGAEFIKLDGGAGYLLRHEGKEYAAISVYLSEEEAKTVQCGLPQKGKGTKIVEKKVDGLYFRNKKQSVLYVNALRIWKEYITLLNGCISKLEKGLTQEACKRLLNSLKEQYSYSQKEYAAYGAFADVCRQSKENLEALCVGNIYVKDLRYFLCWQAEKYISLCKEFRVGE